MKFKKSDGQINIHYANGGTSDFIGSICVEKGVLLYKNSRSGTKLSISVLDEIKEMMDCLKLAMDLDDSPVQG